MSYPTLLSPWFVVQRLADPTHEGDEVHYEYYQHADDGSELWTTAQGNACLFMTLQSAARISAAGGAEVRVLWTKEHAEEFKRG